MSLEIQRVAVLFILFNIYINAQVAQNVGANLEVQDPFATPDVDPFGSMKSSGKATIDKQSTAQNSQVTVTKTVVKTEQTQNVMNQPIVGAGSVKNADIVTSSSSSTSKIVETSGGRGGLTEDSKSSAKKITTVTASSSSTKDGNVSSTSEASSGRISVSSGNASSESDNTRRTTLSTSATTGSDVKTATTKSEIATKTSETDSPVTSGSTTKIPENTSTTVQKPDEGKARVSSTSGTTRTSAVTKTVMTETTDSGTTTTTRKASTMVNTNATQGGVSQAANQGGGSQVGGSQGGVSQAANQVGGSQVGGSQGGGSQEAGSQGGVSQVGGRQGRRQVGGTQGGASTRRTGDISGDVTKNVIVTRTSVTTGLDDTVDNDAGINLARSSFASGSKSITDNFAATGAEFASVSTSRSSNTERKSGKSTGSTGARISSSQGMDADVTLVDEHPVFVRILYRDQRICENCVGDGTDCYLEHPDDCRKYIRCSASSVGAGMEALEMNCAFGTFWSNVANTCDLASEVFCEKDACRDARLKAYPSDINCRSYWRCVNGRSHSECCPNGQAYENGACVPSDSCKVDDGECPFKFRSSLDPVDKDQSNLTTECHLEAVPGDVTSFKMRNHWATLKCADATRFDENKCTCVPHIFSAVQCKPIADLDFSTYEVENRVRNYVETNNVTNNQGYGLFNGRASVGVPFFKNNQNIGSHFVIRMRFYHDGKQGYDSQVLASNCKTKTGRELSPSFAILLAKTKKQIIFFASTKNDEKKRYGATASISLPYQPEKWTVVELRFLDEMLYASVDTLEADGTSNVVKDEKVLKGTLTTSVMPLMVGNCNMNDGFVGYIDQVKTYVCNPDKV